MVKNRDAEPGGWAFEFRNDHYPDVDDTAFILMALQRVDYPDKPRMEAAIRRGLVWLLSMQNRDGGWGAFDRDNDRTFLTQIPFADHNAMIDPSTADVTARVLECLGRFGWKASHPVVQRALRFLLQDQTEDGSWYGRWGVNYIYGTGGVLRALENFGAFCEGILPARRRLAAFRAESGWRIRRDGRLVLRFIAQRPGRQHAIANCLGTYWPACRGGAGRPRHRPRRASLGGDAE